MKQTVHQLHALIATICVAVTTALCHPACAQLGSAKKQDIKFEVVAIHPLDPAQASKAPGFTINPTPDGYVGTMNVYQLIMTAYAPEDFYLWVTGRGTTSLHNPPAWASDAFVINAHVSEQDRTSWRNQSKQSELLRMALRSLLRDRFGLKIHEESSDIADYKLVAMKKGPKLTATKPDAVHSEQGLALPSGALMVSKRSGNTEMDQYFGATMGDLAFELSRTSGRPVDDMTRLSGRYDFIAQMLERPRIADDLVDDGPLHYLGLELKPGKGHGLALVIDHVDKPSVN